MLNQIKQWFVVNPDSNSYDENDFNEAIELYSSKLDVDYEWTGLTRDQGFGQEKEFLFTGTPTSIYDLITNVTDECHI